MDVPYKLAVHKHVQAAMRGCEEEQARYEAPETSPDAEFCRRQGVQK